MMSKEEEKLEQIATRIAASFLSNSKWVENTNREAEKVEVPNRELYKKLAVLSYNIAEELIKEGAKRRENKQSFKNI